jgi:hypothetical protein
VAESGERKNISHGVTFAFALIIGGLTWSVAEKWFGNRESLSSVMDTRLSAMEEKFLSKEVFQSEMDSSRRESNMRQEEVMRRLDALERRIEGSK